jgi:4-amino-4-deoxy-L-arabinose transferase-like glycosyltransferase
LKTNKTIYWLILILALGLALRVFYFNKYGYPTDDPRRQAIAVNLLEGRGYTYCNEYFPFCREGNNSTASVVPVPVLIYATIGAGAKLFSTHLDIKQISIFHIFLSMLSVLLLYQLGIRFFKSEFVGLVCAFFWATYLPNIILEFTAGAEIIFSFFLILSFYFLLTSLESKRGFYLVGLFFGLAAMSREAFIFYPFIAFLVLVIFKKCSFKNSLLMLLTYLAVLAPWSVRNWVTFNEFIPGGTLSGYNLFRHNYNLGDENYLTSKISRNKALKKSAKIFLYRPDVHGNENEVETDRFYKEEAVKVIKEHPGRYLVLSARRILTLFFDLYYYTGKKGLVYLGIQAQNLLLFLGLLVILFKGSWLRKNEITFIFLFIGYWCLGHALVNAVMRYFVPIVPLVLLLVVNLVWENRTKFSKKLPSVKNHS